MKHIMALALALLAGPAIAAGDDGRIDVFAGKADVEQRTAGTAFEPDGKEYGVRARYQEGQFLVVGSYETMKTDKAGIDLDLDELHLGLGLSSRIGAGAASLEAHYVKFDIAAMGVGAPANFDADGYGVYLGFDSDLSRELRVFTRVGYVNASDGGIDADGFDLSAGVGYRLSRTWGMFAEYRTAKLEDGDDEFQINNIRFGFSLAL